MSFLDPRCSDIGTWRVAADRGRCPDCHDEVPTSLIPAHVDWHIGLRASCGGGELFEQVVELFGDGAGELARIIHDLQIARLRHDDR